MTIFTAYILLETRVPVLPILFVLYKTMLLAGLIDKCIKVNLSTKSCKSACLSDWVCASRPLTVSAKSLIEAWYTVPSGPAVVILR